MDRKSLSFVIKVSPPLATAMPEMSISKALMEIPRSMSLAMISLDLSAAVKLKSSILISEKNLRKNFSFNLLATSKQVNKSAGIQDDQTLDLAISLILLESASSRSKIGSSLRAPKYSDRFTLSFLSSLSIASLKLSSSLFASLSSLYTSSLMEMVLDAMHLCMYAQIYTVWDLELEAAE